MTAKYDHLRINIDELIPTFDDIRKYCELMRGVTNYQIYFTNNEEGSEAKICKLVDELEGTDYEINNLDGMIASFITYKALQIAKENINLEELENEWVY